jgi:hypothetical protein
MALNDLTAKELNNYFRNITKGRQIARKRFNDLKSIINGILYLEVENEIIERNCLRNINYKLFSYKAENTKITSYIEEGCLQIINYLEDDLLASHKTEFLFNPAHRVIKWVKMG